MCINIRKLTKFGPTKSMKPPGYGPTIHYLRSVTPTIELAHVVLGYQIVSGLNIW